MARLTASFALSAVLALATAICYGNGQVLLIIPINPATGCLLLTPSPLSDPINNFLANVPPMRIISRGDTSLSIAANDDGNVAVDLDKTICSDAHQLWFQHFPFTGDNRQFSLVNFDGNGSPRAIQIPGDGTYPVKLAPYNPSNVPPSMLWTQDTPASYDGFYKIRSSAYPSLVLDGLGGNVQEDTVVGAYPAKHNFDNVFWKIKGFLSNP